MHKGKEHFLNRYKGEYIEMNTKEILKELRLFLENTELQNTIYRSNHASNRLILKGVLGKDKQLFLNQIDHVLDNADHYLEKPYRYRGY